MLPRFLVILLVVPFFIILGFYTIFCVVYFIDYKTTKNLDQEQIEKIITDERKKLYLKKDITITLVLVQKKYVSHIKWSPDNTNEFTMEFSSDVIKASSVYHEMYHICRVYKQRAPKIGAISYFLIEEPLAIIYGNTGINLACHLKK